MGINELAPLYVLGPNDGGVGGNGGSISRPDDFYPAEKYRPTEITNAFVDIGLPADDRDWTNEQYDVAYLLGVGEITKEIATALVMALNEQMRQG